MTALEYLALMRERIVELEDLLSPPNYQRFISRRTEVRRKVAGLRGMAEGVEMLLKRERDEGGEPNGSPPPSS